MGLETGTYVDDLIATNPPGTDDKRQGDDHLRLIKTVLRNTFKRASKAFSLPGNVSKSADYTVLSTDENLTISCNTSTGPFTLTLPALSAGDAGWTLYVLKTSTDANPVFLVPPSGTINGYSKIRRSIENTVTRVFWNGSIWTASRPNGGAPIGSMIEYYGANLPNGHLWPDGGTFVAANYVELSTVFFGGNVKPDKRGRAAFGRDDMGAGAIGRITPGGSGIVGTGIWQAGGFDGYYFAQSLLPNVQLSTSGNVSGSVTGTFSMSGSASIAQNGNNVATAVFPDSYINVNTTGTDQHLDFFSNSSVGTSGYGNTQGSGEPGGVSQVYLAQNPRIHVSDISATIKDVKGNIDISLLTVAGTGMALSSASITNDGANKTSSMNGGVAQSIMNNMPPAIICNSIIVAE